MQNESNVMSITEVLSSAREKLSAKENINVYRFDIFKGTKDENGKIIRVKSVGDAYVRDGMKTYTVVLKTFLEDKFYLLQNTKPDAKYDYVILTRETAKNLGRKYFWNNIGFGKVLEAPNHGIMQLCWDVLAGDIYMGLHPVNVTEVSDAVKADAA